MTDHDWGTLSNQAVAAAAVVYFLALLAHLVEWSALVGAGRAAKASADRAAAAAPTTPEPAAEPVGASVGGVERAAGAPSALAGSLTSAAGRAAAPAAAGDDADGADDAARHERVALFGRLGYLLTVIAVACHLVALVGRGMAADPNRVPWGNMYEFTLSGTFVVAAIYIALFRKFKLSWMSPLVVAFVLAVLMVGVIVLYEPVAPLTEALNSYWLVIHVISAILATGAFTLGGITSVVYLIKSRSTKETGWIGRVPSLETLDRVSYRIHAFGFPVWTFAVLITGPIWAHQAWSSYWNWDPKEVWAFITWVVYAGYLHARATAGWRGRRAAILALVGMATLWFNFIGINYFSTTSQHSYAAPATSTLDRVEALR